MNKQDTIQLSDDTKVLISKFIETYQKPIQMQILGLFETLKFQKLLMQKEVWNIYIKVIIEQLEKDLKLLREQE